MPLAQTQKLLARLYTDENLRRKFLSEPDKIGREFNLTDDEIAELASVMPEELNFFADSLFYKRLREVEKLLPQSKKALSDDFEKRFREFSNTFLPTSIKKHLEDAVQFSDFLIEQKIKQIWLKDLIRYEQANLIFNGYGKTFLIRRFAFDVKGISRKGAKAQRKLTIAVWLRIGGKIRHFVW
jgi:hypothetical protein